MPNAIIYVRVRSDDHQNGVSPQLQEAACSSYAQKKGFIIDRIFRDSDDRANRAGRSKIAHLFDYCLMKPASTNAVIVWRRDRPGHIRDHFFLLKLFLHSCGIELYSVTEPALKNASSVTGKARKMFMALQAEAERELRAERARRGRQLKIKSEGLVRNRRRGLSGVRK